MSKSDDVRFTRDGDQFHYLWAARRCLGLLSQTTTLVAVTIEGPSNAEMPGQPSASEGEEVIDVAEYHGGISLPDATALRYIQLKHSTVNAVEEWTMSGLKVTLEGFAKRFQKLRENPDARALMHELTFVFATNRPISRDVYNAIEDACNQAAPRDITASKGLKKYTGLTGEDLAAFCYRLKLEAEHDGFLAQRRALDKELRGYLPGTDSEAFLQIKELVTRKATSEFAANSTITRLDILRVLGCENYDLFPANNLITPPNNLVQRDSTPSIVQAIVDAAQLPVIVHAEGGLGKSVFATQLGSFLPAGSSAIVYDCFGNGEYRSPSYPRHGVRQALVQIANELSSRSLCPPLIPSGRANDADYFRAFSARLSQAITSLQDKKKDALLCIIIDAADNAEMAADESGEGHSFVRKLIRETFSSGVRLVFLCRTHRRPLLAAPPSHVDVPLPTFTLEETAVKLRGQFPDASEQDVHEFHRLSSQNPRVQSTALVSARDIPTMLRNLGPEPKSVDDMLGRLLEQGLANIKEEVPKDLQHQFGRICTALAVLRPMIPLSVITSLVQVTPENLRSFLADLGQSILIKGELLQFRDEPTETWFQEKFKPNQEALREFIAVLRPQASTSAYVAATLPHLLLQAGQMDELIQIALNSSDLPSAHTIEVREVEAQRLQFALRASLRCKRYKDATKLALLAGGLAAAESRQWRTLRDNIDLAGRFFAPEHILGLVAAKELAAGWTGAHHVYDACVLSYVRDFQGDAQSHIRMAREWLKNMQTLPEPERRQQTIDRADISALVLANLNVYGPEKAVSMIARCNHPSFRYSVARHVARGLVDAGHLNDIDKIVISGRHDVALLVAFVQEAARAGHLLPKTAVLNAWTAVSRISAQDASSDIDMEGDVPSLLAALSWMALKLEVKPRESIAYVMHRHLGTRRLRTLGFQHDRSAGLLIKAYVLKTRMAGNVTTLLDLAYPDWHEALGKGGYQADDGEIREFKSKTGALLPWYQLWADILCGEVPADEIAKRIATADAESSSALHATHRDSYELKNEVAIAHAEVIFALGTHAPSQIKLLLTRLSKNDYRTNTLISITWTLARHPGLHEFALEVASKVVAHIEASNEQAEQRAESWASLSRALLTAHEKESSYYFLKSLEVASKIGDENLWRWNALIHIADAASSPNSPSPILAYRFARAAELAYDLVYRDKHFDWQGTVESIAKLCPSSAFTILSRWGDRGFGWRERILPMAVEHLAISGHLSVSVTAALFGFHGQWSVSEAFSSVMKNADSASHREALAKLMYRYIKVEKYDADTWKKIRDVAVSSGIELDGIDTFICQAERQRLERGKRQNTLVDESKLKDVSWDKVFYGLDMASLSSLAEAFERSRSWQTYHLDSNFYAQAALRVQLGRESEFLESLLRFPSFELFELRYLLEDIPSWWHQQLSTMAALKTLVKSLIARHSTAISVSRYYPPLPLDLVERVVKLKASEAIGISLNATAESSIQLGPEKNFELASLLSKLLTKTEAAEVLEFELTRLEEAMDEALGDGPWSEALMPPSHIEEAVAGFVWRALSAPERDLRWEAAHVVRSLCELNCERTIDSLLKWFNGSPPSQFMDSHYVHYHLHAHLWLLMGCARAALEKNDVLLRHIDTFVKRAIESNEQHVLIRGFASWTALSIAASNIGLVPPEIQERLKSVNMSMFSPTVSTRADRVTALNNAQNRPAKHTLHFGVDMPSYWFESLGSRFRKSSGEICNHVEKVVLTQFNLTEAQWDNDERQRRGYYRYEDTRHSHGSYPTSDDLRFYFSFHAMMTVAGELLATLPLVRPAYEDGDYYTFQYWLNSYQLTRSNGHWVSDRRDPEPLVDTDWNVEQDDKDWLWSVGKSDFESFLFVEQDEIAVSARWHINSGSRRQEVSISSALVSVDTAPALLVASQTASDFTFTPQFPRDGDSNDDQVDGFELQGLVVWKDSEGGLDEYDPWAAKISVPPIEPSLEVCKLLDITADKEHRFWYRNTDQAHAMKSRTWADAPTVDRSEREPNHGLLLQARMSTLTELMKKAGKSLIFKVSIARSLSYSYRKGEDEAVKYPAPYIHYFLLDENEQVTSL